jgi:hypothetical protein
MYQYGRDTGVALEKTRGSLLFTYDDEDVP